MFWIVKKELLMRLRYKMLTINLYLYPFFLIAPYVLVSEYYQMEGNVLINMILWVWLCQLLFGISDGISELRIEGTFMNILMSPCGFIGYLFYKYFFHIIDCSIITIITASLSAIFLDIRVANLFLFLAACILFSISLFSFSLLFAGLVLKYKKVRSLNYFLQQVFGFLSGYTNNVYRFPTYIRFFSFLIPLTYSIVFFNQTTTNNMIFIILIALTIIYFLLGIAFLKKELHDLRKRGDVEQW